MTKRHVIAVVCGGVLVGIVLWHVLLERQGAEYTDSALYKGIRTNDMELIERYLAAGGDANRSIEVGNGEFWPMLKVALYDREEDIALALLRGGGDFDASGVQLYQVAREGMPRVLEHLFDFGLVRFEIPDVGLPSAAANGFYDVIEVLLRRASDRDLGEPWQMEMNRAAGSAMLARYDDVARLLLESTADLTHRLHVATRFSSPGIIRYLLSRGVDPSEALPEDPIVPERTPMDFARRRYEELQLALADGINRENHDATRVIYELMRAGVAASDPDFLSIAENGVAEIERIREPATRLVAASRLGYYDVALGLAQNYGDILSEQSLRQALVMAFRHDHDDIARMLLASGAPVSGGALHEAARASSPGMVRFLLASGADPLERVNGLTPVEAWRDNPTTSDPGLVLHELIRGGAEVCWLVEYADDLPGVAGTILRDSATHCW